jgi:hypothetical protein
MRSAACLVHLAISSMATKMLLDRSIACTRDIKPHFCTSLGITCRLNAFVRFLESSCPPPYGLPLIANTS